MAATTPGYKRTQNVSRRESSTRRVAPWHCPRMGRALLQVSSVRSRPRGRSYSGPGNLRGLSQPGIVPEWGGPLLRNALIPDVCRGRSRPMGCSHSLIRRYRGPGLWCICRSGPWPRPRPAINEPRMCHGASRPPGGSRPGIVPEWGGPLLQGFPGVLARDLSPLTWLDFV